MRHLYQSWLLLMVAGIGLAGSQPVPAGDVPSSRRVDTLPATMPMLFVNGGTDFAYPPDSHARTYALVSSPKNLHFVPDLRHGHIFDKPRAVEAFIDHHLKGAKPLPSISPVQAGERHLVAPVTTVTKPLKAGVPSLFNKEGLPAASFRTDEW